MTALLYAAAAGLVIGIASLVEKLGLTSVQPYAGLFLRSGVVMAALGLSLVPFGRAANWSGFTVRGALCIAAGGLLAGLVAHLLYWQSLKATSPAYALPIFLGAGQVAAVALSLTVLRTSISWGQVIGVSLVVAGIILIQVTRP
jgi:transporter family protein